MSNELILPWPARELHPNNKAHWAKKARAAKKARRDGYMLAVSQGWDAALWPDGRLHIWIDGYPQDRRRRDADGLLSSLKSWIDGIADAMGVDDRRFVPHPWIKDEVRTPGEVRIRVTDGGQKPEAA